MKKTLTLLLLGLASFSYAQTNWAIKSIKSPTEIQSTATGTSFDIIVECQNMGTKTIKAGDSITFSMLLIDLASSQILLQYPANAASGNRLITLATEDILPDATYDLSFKNLNVSTYLLYSRAMRMGVSSFIFNRSNPIVDTDSSNNSNFIDLTWWNIDANGVSVNEVDFDNNVSVYPNPAKDVMNISVLKAEYAKTKIELVDMMGKAVLSEQMNSNFTKEGYQLNVSGIENGLYFLKVTNGEEVSTTKVTISH